MISVSLLGRKLLLNSKGESTANAAGVGAAVGGVGDLLAGLAAFAIPGVGQVMGAGSLATAFIGAAAGGVAED